MKIDGPKNSFSTTNQQDTQGVTEKKLLPKGVAIIQLIIFSIIGVVAFFIPFTINGKETILLDHGASYLVNQQRPLAVIFLFAMMIYGVFIPFITGKYKESITTIVLSFFKLVGFVLAVLYVTGMAPEFLMAKDMLPFLFDKLALSVGMIVPIGALILATLVCFGLLEMVGVLMQPVMRPLFKTPGSSAIDAVASFVGSYSIGLLITNRVYLQGQYSAKEAIIIATGFSTVSAAFMIIVAKTLGIIQYWNLFFWSTFIITFLVTAITARIPPIKNADNSSKQPEIDYSGQNRFRKAVELGVDISRHANNLPLIFWSNFRDGIQMAAAIIPTIIAIGLLGLLLAKYTPVFDILGWVLYPFTSLMGLHEPMAAAKGISAGLAEMFLPSLLLNKADILVKFTAAVTSISSVLFFSAMIPCVLATKIPLSLVQMLIIWLQRTVLSIIFAAAVGHIAISLGWLV